MAVLAIVDDLLFCAKLEAAAAGTGVDLHVAADLAAAEPLLVDQPWRLIILDLNLSSADPLAVLNAVRSTHPTAPIVGYCSHVQAELRTRATAAGCSVVVPRSVFVQRLPELMAGTWPPVP